MASTAADGDRKKRVLIACGGTGGHLFPGIAIAEALRARGHAVILLISEKEIDALASEGYGHLEFRTVPSVGMGRMLSIQTVRFLLNSWRAYRQCRKLIVEFGADRVLGMGGFTSTPPVAAGRRLGCATFVHESNAIPGKANRLTARFCNVVLAGNEECARSFPDRTTRVVGTPVRDALRGEIDQGEALARFGLVQGARTLLVMGGSQGAQGVNRLVCESLEQLEQLAGIQVVHIAGPGDFEQVARAYEAAKIPSKVVDFLHQMQFAYAIADLAIARSGGSSLAELAFFGIPSILIPYPFAAEDHQRRNAEVFERAEAAVLVDEKDLTGPALGKTVGDLFEDSTRLEKLAAGAAKLATADAAERICDAIEEGYGTRT
ncbi:MAG: undecaprenyldiphospho-muramoylpentapeptide beta-N-acetylglucosaminyltransferase [Verrucomicrobiales bacterium]